VLHFYFSLNIRSKEHRRDAYDTLRASFRLQWVEKLHAVPETAVRYEHTLERRQAESIIGVSPVLFLGNIPTYRPNPIPQFLISVSFASLR